MNDLLLSEAERDRFADWLEHEARTATGLAEQAAMLGGAMMNVTVRRLRDEAAASLLIARKLRATRSDSI